MQRKVTARGRIAALTLAAGLAACAGQGEESAGLADSGFPRQGALYGAGIGAAAGCATVILQGDSDLKSCMKRAAVGGALGAAAGTATGYAVRGRTERHAADEAGLNRRLQTAQADLDAARQAGADAERVAGEHQATLARLDREVAAGEASRETLRDAAQAARRDADGIRRSRDQLDRKVAALDRELASGGGGSPELVAKRDRLREERDHLDRQLQTLAGAVAAADRLG